MFILISSGYCSLALAAGFALPSCCILLLLGLMGSFPLPVISFLLCVLSLLGRSNALGVSGMLLLDSFLGALDSIFRFIKSSI